MTESDERKPNTAADKIGRWTNQAENFFRTHNSLAACAEAFADKERPIRWRTLALAGMLLQLVPSAKHAVIRALEREYDFSNNPIDPAAYEMSERVGLGTERGLFTECEESRIAESRI